MTPDNKRRCKTCGPYEMCYCDWCHSSGADCMACMTDNSDQGRADASKIPFHRLTPTKEFIENAIMNEPEPDPQPSITGGIGNFEHGFIPHTEPTPGERRGFWIKKGTNSWNYRYYDDEGNEVGPRFSDDDYYDSVSPTKVSNGIHVREVGAGLYTKEEYDLLLAEIKRLKDKYER